MAAPKAKPPPGPKKTKLQDLEQKLKAKEKQLHDQEALTTKTIEDVEQKIAALTAMAQREREKLDVIELEYNSLVEEVEQVC